MSQIERIIELLTGYVKSLKVPKSTISDMAQKIAERGPTRADILFELIGNTLAKQKKSTVLKATEICDALFKDLEDNDLCEPCMPRKVQEEEDQGKSDKLKEEYEAHIAFLQKQQSNLPPIRKIHTKDETRSTEFVLDGCELIVAGKTLVNDARIQLNQGHKYGLVGRNGIGKTQLMSALARGDFDKMPKHLQIVLVEQEVMGTDMTVLESVLETDMERSALMKEDEELAKSEDPDDQDRHLEVMKRLEDIGAFSAPARAAHILTGLGFTHDAQNTATKALSGGWRMRVTLARALFVEPEILLLDEPTNHLDIEAVFWLENYIEKSDGTFVIVSHAREFLNNVCTHTIHFFEQQLFYYKGNFDQFEKTRNEDIKQQVKEYEKQQEEIKRDQALIAKFRANNSRASMAQCRIKKLEKMDVIEKVTIESTIQFNFPKPEHVPPPLIKIENGVFGYTEDKILYTDIQFGVDMDSRIAIAGSNGAGKSTLINLLMGNLSLLEGQQFKSSRARIATFTQHHLDQLDLLKTPLEQMIHSFPDKEDLVYRRHLGMFGVTGNMQVTPIYKLSGGQKSRIAFAICVWNNPHILILDEPTNHLDLDAVNALIDAIKAFQGGILVISHDQHMITSCCDQIWYIKHKKLKKFDGDFYQYRNAFLQNKL